MALFFYLLHVVGFNSINYLYIYIYIIKKIQIPTFFLLYSMIISNIYLLKTNRRHDRYRKDFNVNDMHVEPPFSCDYAKSRNGRYDINGRK